MVSKLCRTSCCRKTITGLFWALVFLASFNCVASSYSLFSFYSSPDEYYYTGGSQLSPLWSISGERQFDGLKSPTLKRSADLDFEDDPNQNILDLDDYEMSESNEEESKVRFSCAFLILQPSCKVI